MESLRDNFNKIVQKALTTEDPIIKDEPTVTDYIENTTESTDVRQQQCGGLLRRDQAGTRKKPRFLSTAE